MLGTGNYDTTLFTSLLSSTTDFCWEKAGEHKKSKTAKKKIRCIGSNKKARKSMKAYLPESMKMASGNGFGVFQYPAAMIQAVNGGVIGQHCHHQHGNRKDGNGFKNMKRKR